MRDELQKPKLIVKHMATGIQRMLDLSDMQVTPAAMPFYDPLWTEFPQIQVCPGAKRPVGKGEGGQAGGDLFREMTVLVAVFYRCKLDQYGGDSKILMLADANGLMDLMENVRDVFAMTQLGTPGDVDSALLYEPMRYAGEGTPTWVDTDNGVVRQDISFYAPFALELPTRTTLNLADVL